MGIYLKGSLLSRYTLIALMSVFLQPAFVEANSSTTEPIGIDPISGSWQLRDGNNSKLKSSNGDNRGTSNVVLTHGDTLFVGGDFKEIYDGGQKSTRNYLAAFNRYTGKPTGFAPNLNNKVDALAVSADGKTLYVGGGFSKADGKNRNKFAAYDIRTGELKDLTLPSLNGWINSLAVDDDRIYVGGAFTKVGSKSQNYVAAFNPNTGALDSNFKPSINGINRGRATALKVAKGKLWIGGNFFKVSGKAQRGLAAVNLRTGALLDTDDVFHDVIDLAASDTQLFVAIGGPGGKAAAINLSTGKQQWQIVSDGNFQAVDVGDGPYVYFGGHYEIMHHHSKSNHLEQPIDFPRNDATDRMTRHLKTTGKMDTSWLPVMNGVRSVNALEVDSDGLYIGGDFTTFKKKAHEGFAIVLGQTNGQTGGTEPEVPVEPDVPSNAKNDYDYSRSVGYLWADGKLVDGKLSFLKRNSSISKHFGFIAPSRFGNDLTIDGNRYFLKSSALGVDGLEAQEFMNEGIPLWKIKDKRAFLTSIIEGEGASGVGRVMDDQTFSKCDYARDLVNSMNSQCVSSKCTGTDCKPANCAFIANGNTRGQPYTGGKCGVYLSGKSADWKSFFGTSKYWFVKTDRTPGGEPTKRGTNTRPWYVR